MLCNVDCDVRGPAAVNEPPKLLYAYDGYSFIELIMEVGIALLLNYYIIVDFKLTKF